jgi:hypothetical protein
LIAFVVNEVGSGVVDQLRGTPPSISTQLEQVKRDAAQRGFRATVQRVDLRGTGARSILMHLVFVAYAPGADVNHQQSDEIRVYDLVSAGGGTRLVRRFAFQPEGDRQALVSAEAWRFRVIATQDLARDGRFQVVGFFSPNRADDADARPVLLAWDPRDGQYKMRGLLTRPVRLRTAAASGDWRVRQQRRAARTAARLEDRRNRVSLRLYGAQDASVVEGRDGPLLVTAAPVSAYGGAAELHAFIVDALSWPPLVQECGYSVVDHARIRGASDRTGPVWRGSRPHLLAGTC